MKRFLRIFLPACVAIVVVGLLLLLPPQRLDSLEANQVRGVLVRFEPWGDETPLPLVESSDREVISGFLSTVKSAQETNDHKCSSRGSIYLRTNLGQTLELKFLPGHNDDYYEYRHKDKIYRVSRPAFVEALKNLGAGDVPLKCN